MDKPIDTWIVEIDANASPLQDALSKATLSGQQFSRALTTAFDGAVVQGKSLGSVFDTLALSLSKMTLQAAFKPIGNAVSTGLGNVLSGQAFNNGFAFANGGVFPGGVPVPFADGGVIASPISFPLAGGAMGLAGERGPEAIMPLTRGPDGRLGVAGGGGSGSSVTFNISTPDAESFRRTETQLAAMLSRVVSQGQRNL